MNSMRCDHHDPERPGRCAARAVRTVALRRLLSAALAIAASPTWAATCNVSAAGLSFGNYDIFNDQSLDAAGTISVSCDVSTSYSIALSPGAGSYGARRMNFGTHVLDYNLYNNATRTIIWGDGSAGTVVVSGTGLVETHTVYGRIPARQNVYVGNYSDIITVTLTF